MRLTKKWLLLSTAVLFFFSIFYACKSVKTAGPAATTTKQKVLVFTKTVGYHHASIPDGVAAIQKMGVENNFEVDSTRDASYFTDDSLKQYSAVIFMSTTLNVLNADQQVALQRYIEAGGGYAGVHAAADTEYDWPWYNKLVGAWFASHPKQQNATIDVVDTTNAATAFLPHRWTRWDEWYNYKNINPDIHVLLQLDESSYEGGINGDFHPIAWFHEFDGGRAFYTGLGHTTESYSEPLILKHLLAGIKYAMGDGKPLDYSKSYAVKAPEDDRFTKTVLSNDLNEPMELAAAPDGRVFFTERAGNFYVYDPAAKQTKLLWTFPVKAVDKYLNGLIGITLDPQFAQNRQLYFFYSSNTGDQYHQNISRFALTPEGALDTTSEKIIIKIPIDLEVSAHTGGSLAWDNRGNLFISTGDNTTPFQSDGYAPLDEREGRKVFDAQRSAGNPNDLRGKILRIHPEADGTYTIPDGNLFQKSMPGTRPEIFVMGCRNPYRISVDTATSWVYWGEVGPDAGNDSHHGPRGYDEFNQARQAGNFGWPFFVGANFPYHDSDFATKEIGPLFDSTGATNTSPNNTGMHKLPPPTRPLIWYPYARSAEFPDLGEGGRCAMGGPVYHYNAALQTPGMLPAYYDGAFFVYDWMRNWVMAVRMDAQGNYTRMEPFMQTTGDFRRPIDIEIGPDGVMYMLEYGSVYGIDNVDARLVRIDFNGGNRAPLAKIESNDTVGLAPLQVKFNGKKSSDFDDDDSLAYHWIFDGATTSDEAAPTFSFAHNGIYRPTLTVTDKAGKSSTDTLTIKVGNTLPDVAIKTGSNSTFFFPKPTALDYTVTVADKEDATIDKSRVLVTLRYIPKVADDAPLMGHQQIDENYNLGKNLVAASDCKACHQLAAKSVGPSFAAVAERYTSDRNAVNTLSNKVLTGGGGVWGEHAMSAHPQLSKEDAMEMVKYVLSVSDKKDAARLPEAGRVVLDQQMGGSEKGRYILSAQYTDGGGAIAPLTTRTALTLRPSKVEAESADKVYNMQQGGRQLGSIHNGSFFMLQGIDLKDVTGITYHYASRNRSAAIVVHADSLRGAVLSSFNYEPTGAWNKYTDGTAPLTATTGLHDLYFVFAKRDTPNRDLAALDWLRFEGGIEVAPAKVKVADASKLTNDENNHLQKAKPPTKTAAESKTASPGLTLMRKSDCATCHAQNKKLVGPSFVQIANHYKGSSAIPKLVNKVIAGGAGTWGAVPMMPHPQLSKRDATVIVKYILAQRR